MGSVEMRAAHYMENDTTRRERWDNEWWCDESGYFDLVWMRNTWPSEQEATTQRQHVIQSVMQWVKSGCQGEFKYTSSTPSRNDTIIQPSSPAIHIAGPSTPPLPPATPPRTTDTITTQVKQVSNKIIHHSEMQETQTMHSSCSDIQPFSHPRYHPLFHNLLVWKMTIRDLPFILQVSLSTMIYQVNLLCLLL